LGAALAQGYAHFFMVGLGKLYLLAKFEVASFRLCTNIEGKPQKIGNIF